MPTEPPPTDNLDVEVARVIAALNQRGAAGVPEDIVEGAVRESFQDFAGAAVRDFVGVLVERRVREHLRHGSLR